MGDFEDYFGAGADADSIISSNCKSYGESSNVEKARWFKEPTKQELAAAIAKDELQEWSKAMRLKGYFAGPKFNSYKELQAWDKEVNRPHVRRRFGVFYMVFLTDGKPFQNLEKPKLPSNPIKSWRDDSDIPF